MVHIPYRHHGQFSGHLDGLYGLYCDKFARIDGDEILPEGFVCNLSSSSDANEWNVDFPTFGALYVQYGSGLVRLSRASSVGSANLLS